MTDKPGHRRVECAELQRYRAAVDTENIDALCSHCDEFEGADTPCSDSCGKPFVWVDDLHFVKMKLDGFA